MKKDRYQAKMYDVTKLEKIDGVCYIRRNEKDELEMARGIELKHLVKYTKRGKKLDSKGNKVDYTIIDELCIPLGLTQMQRKGDEFDYCGLIVGIQTGNIYMPWLDFLDEPDASLESYNELYPYLAPSGNEVSE